MTIAIKKQLQVYLKLYPSPFIMEDTNRPYEKDIEVAFLGLILNSPDVLFSIKDRIKPDMFSSSVNKTIYRSVLDLFAKNVEVDFVLLANDLSEKNKLDESGGDEYLAYLFQNPGKLKNLDEYISKLITSFKIRSLLQVQSKIAPALSTFPVDQVITDLTARISSIMSVDDTRDTIKIGDSLDNFIRDLQARRDNPGLRGISTGFRELDFYTGGFIPGDVWYIGARPSMGKSAMLIKLLLNSAMAGNPVLFFSKEMRIESINDRIFSMLSGVPLQNIRLGSLTDSQFKRIEESRELVKNIPFLIDQNFMGTTDYVISTIRKFHHQYGIKLVAVDYIQLLVERSENSTHELGLTSRKLKLTSVDLGLTSLVASQMNRNVEMRDDKRPMMSDLRQSGNLEEDADIMAALYRDEVYTLNSPKENKMEFIIRKQRNGPLGTVEFDFNKERAEPYE